MHCSRNGRPSLGYTAPQITLGPGHENFISAVPLMGIHVQACRAQTRKTGSNNHNCWVPSAKETASWMDFSQRWRKLDHKVFITSQWPQKHQREAKESNSGDKHGLYMSWLASLWRNPASLSSPQTSWRPMGRLRNANGAPPLIWLLISPGKCVIIIMW